MITTIIFDIGNVLVDFNWKEYIASFGFSEEVQEKLAKATMLSREWDEFDRGVLEIEDIIQKFIQNDSTMEKEIRMICENVHDMLGRRDYAIPWIQDLKKKGYGVYYLSNFSQKAEAECAHTLDFLPYMDGGILSYQEKCIKPEPEIYQILINRYHLIPEQCVFMDDKPVNCEGAKKAGMHTIVFTTKEEAEKELLKLGIK
ncbi:MAG: HAD family phosphatase [Roseburia sp.]|nr:HAD family phosphatase [Roseburia sp.]MCM1280032.1 HAD family phosphatase [Robinsoniella sp.]